MHPRNLDFILLALLLALCHSAPLPGNTLFKRLPEILNIIPHSGQITHDVSRYFQSETPDAHARLYLNTTTAFKSLSLEQIMSSDHPPYKRDDILGTAAPKAFPMLVEPTGHDRNQFVHLTHGLQSSGRSIKRSNLAGTQHETRTMLSTDSPCLMEDLLEIVDLPENVDYPRADA